LYPAHKNPIAHKNSIDHKNPIDLNNPIVHKNPIDHKNPIVSYTNHIDVFFFDGDDSLLGQCFFRLEKFQHKPAGGL
jgi:hypothetical protein